MTEKEPPKTVEEAKSFILRRVLEDSKQCLVTRRRELKYISGYVAVEIDEIWYPRIPERIFLVSALDEMIISGFFVELMKDTSVSVFRETYQLTAKGMEAAEKLGWKRNSTNPDTD